MNLPTLALLPLCPTPGLLDVIRATGFAGPVLLMFGAVAATKAVRRWLALRPSAVAPESLQRGLEHAVRAGQLDQALALAIASPTPLGRLVAAGLQLRAGGLDEMLANCERAAMKEAMLRQSAAAGLARFGTVLLLFSVFGTVLGFMSTLEFLGAVKEPTMHDAILGIRESLGVAAIGLFLVLACFVAWSLLSSRAVLALHRVREIADEIVGEAGRPDRSR